MRYCACQTLGFHEVEADGLATRYGTVVAAAGADVTQNHEGGTAAVPTLADIGTAGLLTNGVEVAVAQQIAYLEIVRAAGHPHFQPGWKASCRVAVLVRSLTTLLLWVWGSMHHIMETGIPLSWSSV